VSFAVHEGFCRRLDEFGILVVFGHSCDPIYET
jgi:hypothetical protein